MRIPFFNNSKKQIDKEFEQISNLIESLDWDLFKNFIEEQDIYIQLYYNFDVNKNPIINIDYNINYKTISDIYKCSENYIRIFGVKLHIEFFSYDKNEILNLILTQFKKKVEQDKKIIFRDEKIYDYFHNKLNFNDEILISYKNEFLLGKFHCFDLKDDRLIFICNDQLWSFYTSKVKFIKLTDEMKFFQCIKTLKT